MTTIREIYKARCLEAGDVNEHLPILNYFSRKSHGVIEFGVSQGVSATALIDGQTPVGWYEGYDINGDCAVVIERLEAISGCDATFINQSSLEAKLKRKPDLLFIDSLHTDEVVKRELELHLDKAQKYVAFHDTVTFGETGEAGKRGILYGMGMMFFDKKWSLVYESPRNNGIMIFERLI